MKKNIIFGIHILKKSQIVLKVELTITSITLSTYVELAWLQLIIILIILVNIMFIIFLQINIYSLVYFN